MPASESLPNLLTVSENVWTLTLGTYSGSSVTSATYSDGTAELFLHSLKFDTSNGGPDEIGEMSWNSVDGTLDLQVESGVQVPLGEQLLIRVRNTSGVTIPKGKALVYTGTTGASGKLEVAAWEGSNVSNIRAFLGFAVTSMDHNTNGYAVWIGKLSAIDTDGGDQGEVWEDGQIIYAIPGASATITNVQPTSGDYVIAAALINAGSGTSGSLFARPTFEAETVLTQTAIQDAITDEAAFRDDIALGTAATADTSNGGNGPADVGKVAVYDFSGNLAAQNLIAFGSVSGDSLSASTGLTANTGVFFTSLSAGSTLFVDGVTGRVGVGNSSPSAELDVVGDLICSGTLTAGDLVLYPSSSITPANIGNLVIEATSNTSVTIKLKGSDGVVRSTVLTLS